MFWDGFEKKGMSGKTLKKVLPKKPKPKPKSTKLPSKGSFSDMSMSEFEEAMRKKKTFVI